MKAYLATVVLLAAVSLPTAAYAEYRCGQPRSTLDRRACEAAKQGPAELRRYIQRVRAIESLWFSDYIENGRLAAVDPNHPREVTMHATAKSTSGRKVRVNG